MHFETVHRAACMQPSKQAGQEAVKSKWLYPEIPNKAEASSCQELHPVVTAQAI